jgi:hypothetical protein
MPSFCRHNRFVERCPICSKELQGGAPSARGAGGGRRRSAGGSAPGASTRGRRTIRGEGLRVRHQQRAPEDGYRSPLVPGVRASADAERLAEEVAFSNGRLLALAGERADLQLPDLYAEVRSLLPDQLERATWTCFLIAYLCPLEGPQPFAGIRAALAVDPAASSDHAAASSDHAVVPPADAAASPDLSGVALGPRSSHDPARGTQTREAYRQWAAQAGSQARAFTGDASWSAERRFARVFERLALPGLTRAARYELLVLLGGLGAYELQADSLHLSTSRVGADEDATVLAAKRLFAIGDPLLLERRAGALAQALEVPIASLDLALASWGAGEHVSLGFPAETSDAPTLARARDALGL